MHDVLVVGGSLGGAATAVHLAEAGLGVLLVERAGTLARRKACGEGLFPRGVTELARLGLREEIEGHAALLAGVRFHAGPFSVEAPFGPGAPRGLGVQRSQLDPLVLERARAAGVEVRTGVAVRSLLTDGPRFAGVRTTEGDLYARVIVAADGLRSRLRKQAGLERPPRAARYGVSAHAVLPVEPGSFVNVYFERDYELYVTPVGGRTANIALLLRRPAMARLAGRLTEGFIELVRGQPALCEEIELIDRPVAVGPFAARCTQPWRANLVLVGDAVGFLDPINGEGMSTALVSARLCAAAVVEYLAMQDEDAFRRYAMQRRALVRNSNLLARLSLTLAARPALARLAVRNLGRQPQTFARLTAVSTGEAGLASLRPRDLLAFALGR